MGTKRPYTVQRAYMVPIYQNVVVHAESVEEACRLAIIDEDGQGNSLDWESVKTDYDSSGPTYVDDISSGEYDDPCEAPKSMRRTVPPRFTSASIGRKEES